MSYQFFLQTDIFYQLWPKVLVFPHRLGLTFIMMKVVKLRESL